MGNLYIIFEDPSFASWNRCNSWRGAWGDSSRVECCGQWGGSRGRIYDDPDDNDREKGVSLKFEDDGVDIW